MALRYLSAAGAKKLAAGSKYIDKKLEADG
jgi:hypothetical protein